MKNVTNRTNCKTEDPNNEWINQKYNFDDLGQALMSLFVLSSKDGWVGIMYSGLDAVDVDMQVCYREKVKVASSHLNYFDTRIPPPHFQLYPYKEYDTQSEQKLMFSLLNS